MPSASRLAADNDHMRGRKDREDVTQLLSQAQRRVTELEAQLRSQSERDAVTGLLSLQRFRAQLDIEVDRARRHGRSAAVSVLDIDGFRRLNARLGHEGGDLVLKATAEVVGNRTRAHDVATRTGGDEFLVLMPETDVAGAVAYCERIVLELETTKIDGIEGLSLSAGVAAFDRSQSGAELVGAATVALDRARAEGGGKVVAGDGPSRTIDSDQRDAVSALSIALLERDRYTGEHSNSVVELVGSVARGLGLDYEEVERITAAAQLHDIGKVAIPDEILNKPSGLTEEQWKVMKDHTVIGERIMRAIPGLGNVARIVRHEHERWDGGGYPDGIAGEEIPVGARIILACDAYHAMVSDRPYRKAMSHAEAVDELIKNAGLQFDPSVVEVVVGALYGSRQAGAAV